WPFGLLVASLPPESRDAPAGPRSHANTPCVSSPTLSLHYRTLLGAVSIARLSLSDDGGSVRGAAQSFLVGNRRASAPRWPGTASRGAFRVADPSKPMRRFSWGLRLSKGLNLDRLAAVS